MKLDYVTPKCIEAVSVRGSTSSITSSAFPYRATPDLTGV